MDPQPERASPRSRCPRTCGWCGATRNFRRLWLAQIVSEIGDWFYTLAIYSLLLQLTGRASSVALALVLQVLPQTLIGPAAGVINDRVRRKRVMITADLARMVIVFAMLLVRSRSTVWLVYPLLLLETLMAAFFEPARTAVIPNIAAREDVLLANTLSSATWSVNLLIGASVGGVVAALLGRDAVFVLNALSFLVSAILISRMRFEEPHAKAAAPLRARDAIDFSPVLEGIRYVRKDRRLLTAVFGKAGELMIGPSWVLFTVMGVQLFPCTYSRYRSAARSHAGHEPAAGSARHRRGLWAAFLGTLGGTIGSSAAVGHPVRISHHWDGILRPGHFAERVGGVPVHRPGPLRRIDSVGLFHYAASTQYRRPFRGRVFSADLGFSMLTIAIGAYVCGVFLDHGVSARWWLAERACSCCFRQSCGLWRSGREERARLATRKHGGLAKLERVEGA